MNTEMKCVMVIDEELPMGLISNTAAILGMTFGKLLPDLVGCDVSDAQLVKHTGVITIPLPILKGHGAIKTILEKLKEPQFEDVLLVDFTQQAQECKAYEDYIQLMKHTDTAALHYMGIALYGTKKQINALTGSMPLLR